MNAIHAEPPFRVITQNQETVAMTSTAESKRFFKITNCTKMKNSNVMSAFSWSGVFVDIYFF